MRGVMRLELTQHFGWRWLCAERMFAVLYRWRVREDMELEFQRAWELLTREFRDRAGSLGSRLHRSAEGEWVAYAQWPSREVWESARVESAEGKAALELLSRAADTRLEPVLLESVADYLVAGPQ